MQPRELLAWHQPAFAFEASQDQYEVLLVFVPPFEQTIFLLAVCGVGDQANDADCPHQHLQQACKQQ